MSSTVIYPARRIITMNAHEPFATHVAVRDGRVLGVGSLAELEGWGPYDLDRRFESLVLMPGFVEGHSHAFEGGVWNFPYVGFFDRRSPDGAISKGLTSIEAVVARLREIERGMTTTDGPLLAWGFDPIYFGGRRMNRADLDKVSVERPVLVIHSNFHVLNVNSPVLAKAGIDHATNVHGIVKDDAGQPTGELQEIAAKYMAYRASGINLAAALSDEAAVWRFARVAQLAGVTTATDLHNELPDSTVTGYLQASAREDFPIRLLPAFGAIALPVEEGVAKLQALVQRNNERLRFGLVKIITDGSIQGLSARMRWPGYYNGLPNGVWNTGPEEIDRLLQAYHDAGFQVHIHTNGDEASEVALDAIERALVRTPRRDHRHTLQHCQMADAAQFRRMAALGACVNLFANHLFYWGDIHYAQTLGPERANRMDACGTALRAGVPFAIHCDAPVTPIGPLFTAWCAVNRLTASGRTLGEAEKISVADALRAVTLGAAYTLKLDHEIGSIEVGKRADFAVLHDDPLEAAPEALKDVRVWGTVLGGRVFEAPAG
ncbi:amidohydrolase [Reyranella sp. CPCC 100927]|uniref:amidohydrolase n=1 Tax=Reyranella sp. CPCC 100927 TaxID=2599616 RepID=UPI0011B3C340|nr:amidohydrolase [Reyranella sp. CPCC 100927]TWT13507.1 amidohydrolase [Reyranella sp. CPCC 100927]